MHSVSKVRSSARRWLAPTAAITGGAALALAAAASPVIAGHSPVADHSPVGNNSPVAGVSPVKRSMQIEIEAPVIRGAKGAVVYVPVSIVCSAGPNAEIYGDLSQSVGTVIRTGYGYATAPCDDKAHVVTLPIVANSRALTIGKAFVRVSAHQYLAPEHLSDVDQEEVKIRLR